MPNEELFRYFIAETNKKFDEQQAHNQKRFDTIDLKLEELNTWKAKVIASSAVGGALLGVVVQYCIHLFGNK